ncbi:hypothetical protein WJX77_001969 [Trebouxia sp. C0004]
MACHTGSKTGRSSLQQDACFSKRKWQSWQYPRVAFLRPFQHPHGLWALDWCSKQRLVGLHKHTRTLTGVNRAS